MPKGKLGKHTTQSHKLGKGAEIFDQPADLSEIEAIIQQERAEKTIFMIRPTQRQTLEEFVWHAKRHCREVNNSMVIRCLLSIFAELDVQTEGIESEAMLRDRMIEALNDINISV